MFENEELKNHLETSYSVKSDTAAIAEWNMNIPGNVQKLGNYRYRKNDSSFGVLPNLFDINDAGGFYTGATNSDITVEAGFQEDGQTPLVFTYSKDKEKILYSLEDCLKPFRPRSGINKLSYFNNKFLSFENQNMYLRPRYYMSSRDDEFRYWRSYRTESDFISFYPVSDTAVVDSVTGSANNWTATITGISSLADLQVNKVLTSSSGTQISLGNSATVGSITGSGPWTATLTGLTSTAGVIVGDRLTAVNGTGKLANGAGSNFIVVSAILSSTSLRYTVSTGSAPEAGVILNVKTVPGSLGISEAKITKVTQPSTIEVLLTSTTSPVIGSIKKLTVNKYLNNVEYGISKNSFNNRYEIDDTNPFVVYKEQVPANRIVVKVQTNVGSLDLGPFKTTGGQDIPDPFYGESNQTTPKTFKIQYLDQSNQWLDAYVFNETSLRDDQISPIFGADGYLSLEYGIQIPVQYKDNFVYLGIIKSQAYLPSVANKGQAYIIAATPTEKGILFIYNGISYDQIIPVYEWFIGTDGTYENTHFVTDFTNPSYFNEVGQGQNKYREFVWIKGLRLAVETMNTPNSPLELIELSPRLVSNVSHMLMSYQITKSAGDLSGSPLPVGQMLAGIGSVNLFDNDNSFNENNIWDFENNTGSIIAKYSNKNIKFTFYDIIKNVNQNNYYVPLKTLYSEGFPKRNARTGEVEISLRDFYFYLESIKAPKILLTDVSLSQAICLLLDAVGFSNYIFKRLPDQKDPIIPFFFIQPDQNVAEVLLQLARATQAAMFFDEYNNFVVMTKEYLLDDTAVRTTDTTLYGSNVGDKVANIESIAAQDKQIYNAGTINYTTRYIARTGGTIAQNKFKDTQYIYKPSLLWEVGGTEKTSSMSSDDQSGYVLSAVPLNTNLSDVVPSVSLDRVIINNEIDIGENAYYLSKFKGFLYANGEVIKYDAIQYSITGAVGINGTSNVWISSNLEYQKYVQDLPFNGKIYPTGLVRIYAEPYYETFSGIAITQNNQEIGTSVRLSTGAVVSHGRGQFGTKIVSHQAGLNPYWSSNDNIQGCEMQSEILFSTAIDLVKVLTGVSSSGTTLTVPSTLGLSVGQNLNILDGTGALSSISGGTKITAINTPTVSGNNTTYTITVNSAPTTALNNATVEFKTVVSTAPGAAGVVKSTAEKTQRNGIIRNFLSTRYATETEVSSLKTTKAGTIQSSALVMTGPDFDPSLTPRNYVSYVYKKFDRAYKHYGTRLRIIGKIESSGDRAQSVVGGMTYFNVPGTDPTKTISVGGGSAGINLVNPLTNNGYYFELAALTASNIEDLLNKDDDGNATVSVENILFYKILKNGQNGSKAVPVKLWGGIGNILVDDGNFAGQYRFFGEENPTVYDLAIEYVDISPSKRLFYLFINQKLVARVLDEEPLPLINPAIGLFVRGNSKAMFENVYALSKNYATNSVFDTGVPLASIFGDDDNQVNASEALSRYSLSGMIQATYLSGINPTSVPAYDMYFEEFGTIMREAAYFNVKYDKAFPALYAKIATVFNRIKGYTVSGFTADSYGAEFLVFNNTDSNLVLDASSGNYLRIQGVAFTGENANVLSVDDYLQKKGSLSDPELLGSGTIDSPFKFIEEYDKVKRSRLLYGKTEFSLDSVYIQNQDTAEDLIGWMIGKTLRPRKSVGLKIFSMPTLQLGDIVNINYKDNDGVDMIGSEDVRYAVYNIEYSRDSNGPNMNIYLSEV